MPWNLCCPVVLSRTSIQTSFSVKYTNEKKRLLNYFLVKLSIKTIGSWYCKCLLSSMQGKLSRLFPIVLRLQCTIGNNMKNIEYSANYRWKDLLLGIYFYLAVRKIKMLVYSSFKIILSYGNDGQITNIKATYLLCLIHRWLKNPGLFYWSLSLLWKLWLSCYAFGECFFLILLLYLKFNILRVLSILHMVNRWLIWYN